MKKYEILIFMAVVGLSQPAFCMESSGEKAAPEKLVTDEEDTSPLPVAVDDDVVEVDEADLAALSEGMTTLHELCEGLAREVGVQGSLIDGFADHVAAAQARIQYESDELLRLRPVNLSMMRERFTRLIQGRLLYAEVVIWGLCWDRLVALNLIRLDGGEEITDAMTTDIKNNIQLLQELTKKALIADFNADQIYDLVVATRRVRALSHPLTVDVSRDER